jgi:hypothetical protein
MNDINGRPYATIAETKEGTKLEADDGFDCIKCGTTLVVCSTYGALYIPCTAGEHLLLGQISADDTCYAGLYCVG